MTEVITNNEDHQESIKNGTEAIFNISNTNYADGYAVHDIEALAIHMYELEIKC